jgi:hypothetical protein
MRRKFEFLSGVVLILASMVSMLMITRGSIGGCTVVGESLLSYIIAYSIVAILAVLGIIYIIQTAK